MADKKKEVEETNEAKKVENVESSPEIKGIALEEFVKNTIQPMTPWTEDLVMEHVSISDEDKKNGSPKKGDMIAVNPNNFRDQWLISKEFFEENYIPANRPTKGGDFDVENKVPVKSLHNTTANGAKKNVKDIVFWGNGDTFKLISKASSEAEGWMKSTKAMDVRHGVVVQVTTQQRNPDGSYAVAEAITYIPGVKIIDMQEKGSGPVTGRYIG
jgi:hypothetical protein